MKNIFIRDMLIDDALAVATINISSWRHAYKDIVPAEHLDSLNIDQRAESWAKGIKENESLIRLVALIDNKLVGYACGLKNRKIENPQIQGELFAIYVDPNFSQQGIGTELVKEFKHRLKKTGLNSMSIWTLEENRSAHRFYTKIGGELTSLRKELVIGGKNFIEICFEFKSI